MFSLVCFAVINIVMIIYWLYGSSSRGLGFPVFAGTVALAIVVPQGIAFLHQPELLPEGGFTLTMFFATLCTLAIWMGFAWGKKNPKPFGFFESDTYFNDKILFQAAFCFTLLGSVFFIALNHIEIERDPITGNWTGIATILLFFAQWLKVGFVMALYLALKNRKRGAWILVCIGLVFILPAIFLNGRRADSMQFMAAILLLNWFVRHRTLPRWCFLGLILGMIFAASVTGTYRHVMKFQDYTGLSYWERLGMVNWIDAYQKVLEDGGGRELLNCIHGISAADQQMKFDCGIPLWNLIVWSFIPGQIISPAAKQALYLQVNWPLYNITYDSFPDYVPLTGSMWLGYTDAFQSFWWFRAATFFLIAWIMGRVYSSAEKGSSGAICFYTWIFNFALHIIPALTFVFWTNLIYWLVFCMPFLFLLQKCNQSKCSVEVRNP